MRAAHHRTAAKARGWPATHCDGFIRRIFVRPGNARLYVAVGWLCDECGASVLDEDRQERIAGVKALPARKPVKA